MTVEAATLTFGEYVRRLRRSRGLQGRQLAETMGISPIYLSRLENDHAKPSADLVIDLARVLDVEPVALMRVSGCLSAAVLALMECPHVGAA